jgi:hypothetical protein
MSAADIACCRTFDIEALGDEPLHGEMQALHGALAELYPADDDDVEAAA